MLRSSVLALQRVTIPAQRGFRPLSGKWYDLLVTGEHWHHSRSEALRSFLMHVANLGWDWAEVWFHLSQPERYKLAQAIWTRREGRSRTDALKRAEAEWNRVLAKVASSLAITDKATARQELRVITAHLTHSDMRRTDRHVLTYFHAEGQRRGRIILAVSMLDISLGASVSKSTALRSVPRLLGSGWLSKHEERHHKRHAQVYRLRAPGAVGCAEVECTDDTTVPSRRDGRSTRRANCGVSGALDHAPVKTARQDAFLALGRYAAAVFEVLSNEPIKAEEIVQRTGMARRTVFKWLKGLNELGLASSDGGWWIRGDRPLQEVAKDLDAVGEYEVRKARIEMSRAGWDLIADKVQYNADKARYGSQEAVKRAVETSRARHQQLALSDSQTTTVNTRIGKELANVIPAPRDVSMAVRDATESSARKRKPANGELVDTSTSAVRTAGDEVQEAAQECQEPGIVLFLPNLRSEARAQRSAAMAA
ncbi:hypothetical protein ACFWIZ_05200 [Streptomyces sp. NPDC127044]